MPLLAEYAITPDVLFSSFYSSTELEDALVSPVANSIMASGLVRDLRDGEWSELLSNPECHLNPRSKHFIMMLINKNRLRAYQSILPESPVTSADWCQEAFASHLKSCLSGIITTKSVAEQFKSKKHIVAAIHSLGNGAVEWWQPLKGNEEVKRDIDDYLFHLRLFLEHANSLYFVDGNLDPTKSNYRNFVKLIDVIARRKKLPLVQIHRQEFYGTTKDKKNSTLSIADWKERFTEKLQPVLAGSRLKVQVYIWNRIKDRYFLSDLAGIAMNNGFDEGSKSDPISITTWSRLDRKITEDRYRMYDEAYRRKDLIGKFTVG